MTELLVAIPPSLMVPHACGVLIELVISSLLDNAFPHVQPPVRFSVRMMGLSALVEVDDCGSGIAPEDEQAMLQAFSGGDTARRHPGLGLLRGSVRFLVCLILQGPSYGLSGDRPTQRISAALSRKLWARSSLAATSSHYDQKVVGMLLLPRT